MKRIILIVSLAVGTWMLSPTPQGEDWSFSPSVAKAKGPPAGINPPGLRDKGGTPPGLQKKFSVPELDPSAAGSALILLLGGAAYIMSRRREEDHA